MVAPLTFSTPEQLTDTTFILLPGGIDELYWLEGMFPISGAREVHLPIDRPQMVRAAFRSSRYSQLHNRTGRRVCWELGGLGHGTRN